MSYTPNNAWNSSPQTGLAKNPGPFLAEVMRNNDPLYSGRLLVYIPDFGGDPEQESSWHLVRFMSPYYGIQPLSNRLAADPADPNSLESYGMWMTPPDLGVKVLVMFINGDRSKGVWMGCLPEIGSHGAIPGNDAGDFDVFANQSAVNNDIKSIPRPEHSTAPTFTPQGLDADSKRGKPITTSSLRESPTKVFGMNTPSGHSFFMDDGDESGTNKMLRMRTAAGNMIMMNDDNGFVYIINAKGTGWIELSPNGFVDIYGELGVSIGTPGNIDMHAAGNINMHAGQNIKMVAEKEAKFQGTEKTKIYGGRLFLQGSDSLEMYSCGMIKSTGSKGMHFKSEGNFVLEGRVFKWNSGSAQEAEQVAPDESEKITGYTSTVLRAPNKEPWAGHDESYEESPKGPTGSVGTSATTDSAFDSPGGLSSKLDGKDGLGGIFDSPGGLSSKLDGKDGLGGISSSIAKVSSAVGATKLSFGNIGTTVNSIGSAINNIDLSFGNITGIPAAIENTVLSFGELTEKINTLPLESRTRAFNNLGVGGDIEKIEKDLKEQGLDRINIGEIDSVIRSGINEASSAFQNIAGQINVTDISTKIGISDEAIRNINNITNTVGQIGDIAGTINQINLKDLSIGGISNTIGNIENLTDQLNFDNFSLSKLLPLDNKLVNGALSIRSNILNAESLIGELAVPLTSLSALKDGFSLSGISGLSNTIGKLNQLTQLPGQLANLAGSATEIVGNISDTIGDIANFDFGKIGETLSDLPLSIPKNLTDIIPPDIGDALTDATASFDNIASTQASTIIPAAPGGGVAPASAIGSDCATPITRGGNTPESQQNATGGNAGNAYSGAASNVVPPDKLANDPAWQAELAKLKQRFPQLREQDLYKVIKGESKFNSTIVNADSGATGLFQFIPATARGLGTTTGQIQQMTPAEQLKVYGKYLGQFNYAGGPLGIMQAAPGTYSNLIRKFGGNYSNVPGNYEVYGRSTKAWRQNPGWRGPDGRITINSINAYYAKQK